MDSQFPGKTIDRLNLNHPDLNTDGIRTQDSNNRLPFYWQMWQWVLSGEITTRNTDTFFS
jgi:hypothetical protein